MNDEWLIYCKMNSCINREGKGRIESEGKIGGQVQEGRGKNMPEAEEYINIEETHGLPVPCDSIH